MKVNAFKFEEVFIDYGISYKSIQLISFKMYTVLMQIIKLKVEVYGQELLMVGI